MTKTLEDRPWDIEGRMIELNTHLKLAPKNTHKKFHLPDITKGDTSNAISFWWSKEGTFIGLGQNCVWFRRLSFFLFLAEGEVKLPTHKMASSASSSSFGKRQVFDYDEEGKLQNCQPRVINRRSSSRWSSKERRFFFASKMKFDFMTWSFSTWVSWGWCSRDGFLAHARFVFVRKN